LYGAGQSIDTVTYYGRAAATSDFDSKWVVGVEGPLSLVIDTSKPIGQQLQPNPFNISAFVFNRAQLPLSTVTAILNLPPGLQFAAGETATKQTANLQPNTEVN